MRQHLEELDAAFTNKINTIIHQHKEKLESMSLVLAEKNEKLKVK